MNIFEWLDKSADKDPVFNKWTRWGKAEKYIIDQIIKAREAQGLMQSQLSKLLPRQFSQSFISRLENSVMSPKLQQLIPVLDELNLSLEIKSIEELRIRDKLSKARRALIVFMDTYINKANELSLEEVTRLKDSIETRKNTIVYLEKELGKYSV